MALFQFDFNTNCYLRVCAAHTLQLGNLRVPVNPTTQQSRGQYVRPQVSKTLGSSPRTYTIQSQQGDEARRLLLSCLKPLREHRNSNDTVPQGTVDDRRYCQADVSVQASCLGNMIQQDGESRASLACLPLLTRYASG